MVSPLLKLIQTIESYRLMNSSKGMKIMNLDEKRPKKIAAKSRESINSGVNSKRSGVGITMASYYSN